MSLLPAICCLLLAIGQRIDLGNLPAAADEIFRECPIWCFAIHVCYYVIGISLWPQESNIASILPRRVSIPLYSFVRRPSTWGRLSALLGGPVLSRDMALSLRARNVERNATTRRVLHRDESSSKNSRHLGIPIHVRRSRSLADSRCMRGKATQNPTTSLSESITMSYPSLVRQRFVLSSNAVPLSCKRACET